MNEKVGMISGFTQFHISNFIVGRKMKNKRCCSVEYVLTKNVISIGNSIIHCWISMLLTGICGAMACTAALKVDDGGDCENRLVAVWI